MPTPSSVIVPFMRPFAIAFTRPTFEHVLTLMGGTLLASARRTVASALRAVCLIDEPHFTTYHRVLNRAVWFPLQRSQDPAWIGDRHVHRDQSAARHCRR